MNPPGGLLGQSHKAHKAPGQAPADPPPYWEEYWSPPKKQCPRENVEINIWDGIGSGVYFCGSEDDIKNQK